LLLLLLAVLVLAIAIPLTSCRPKPTPPPGTGPTGTTGPSTSSAPASGEPIVLGLALELTGPIAPYGKAAKQGAELAIDDVNAAASTGASPFLKGVVEDCRSDPVSATRKLLVEDDAAAVVGFVGSSLLLAAAPLFEEHHTVLVSPGASSPAVSDAGDFVFRTRSSGDVEAKALARYASGKMGVARVGVLYVNNDYGKSWLEAFTDGLASTSTVVSASEAYAQGATSFREQLTKLRSSHPDCLLVLGYLQEIAAALRERRELALDVPMLTTVGVQDPQIFSLAGRAADGVVYVAVDYDPDRNDQARRFAEAYLTRYGMPSDMFAANAYDAVMILADAFSKVGVEGPAVRDYLVSMQAYDGVGGEFRFDAKGDVSKPITIKRVHDGRFETIPGQTEGDAVGSA